MKITLFTANQRRHNFLINQLSSISDELFVVQESRTIFPGLHNGHYDKSKIMKEYFDNVINAEIKIFDEIFIDGKNKNVSLLPLVNGDLNDLKLNDLDKFLKSDLYIIFGSSFIKGDLVKFLIEKKAINIHMGISPYYRGTDCNFWALYDSNPHLVGATIHMLSKGIDSGKILYHAISNIKKDPFEYTMSTVKAAFISIIERVKNKTLLDIKPITQNKKVEIRYSKANDFNDNILKKFFKKEINMEKKFDFSMLKDPFILEK
jgi:folate-dependent phosphoribosylglycinamide formyltransferase PurN